MITNSLKYSVLRVPGLDTPGFEAIAGEAPPLCPVSRLFAGARITVAAELEDSW